MMALGRSIGHERAHEVVTAAARRARVSGRDLVEVLGEDSQSGLSAKELARVLEPERYLGLAGAAVDAVVDEAAGE